MFSKACKTLPIWLCVSAQFRLYLSALRHPFQAPLTYALLHLDGRIVVECSAFAASLLICPRASQQLGVIGVLFSRARNPLPVITFTSSLLVGCASNRGMRNSHRIRGLLNCFIDSHNIAIHINLLNGTLAFVAIGISIFIFSLWDTSCKFVRALFSLFPSIWSM